MGCGVIGRINNIIIRLNKWIEINNGTIKSECVIISNITKTESCIIE